MTWLLFLLALAAGTANPFQSGTNAELNKRLDAPLWTGMIVYASGLAALLILQLCLRHPLPTGKFPGIPWWAWTGGVISIIPTLIGLAIAQRMGSGLFTGASITAALITSVALDHFGLVGFRQHTASPARLAGCALMVAGLWMIARF
ncbi:MAG: DMT family transporter [Acidobacteriota bacterium]|nr:DMT family transporter [Acidobacteriota bacterium]